MKGSEYQSKTYLLNFPMRMSCTSYRNMQHLLKKFIILEKDTIINTIQLERESTSVYTYNNTFLDTFANLEHTYVSDTIHNQHPLPQLHPKTMKTPHFQTTNKLHHKHKKILHNRRYHKHSNCTKRTREKRITKCYTNTTITQYTRRNTKTTTETISTNNANTTIARYTRRNTKTKTETNSTNTTKTTKRQHTDATSRTTIIRFRIRHRFNNDTPTNVITNQETNTIT